MAQPVHNESEATNRLRRTPLSWAELKEILLSPDVDALSKLARSEEQKTAYRKRRAEIKDEWVSIYDFLLCTKFGFEWAWEDAAANATDNGSAQRRRKRSEPSFEQHLDNQRRGQGLVQYVLCPNDFPYYLAPGVQHWVLWKLGGEVTPDEIANAKLDIVIVQKSPSQATAENVWAPGGSTGGDAKQLVNDHEMFLHWINPPHLKSLPGIEHAHILYYSTALGLSRL